MRKSFAPCIHYLLFFLIVSQTWNHKIIADRFTLVFILVTLSKRKTWRKATISYFGYKNSRRIFLTCLKMTQNIRTETWRSGDCGENQFHRGLDVLVGPIVKIRPWANFPWVCHKSVLLSGQGGFGFEFSACGWLKSQAASGLIWRAQS